MTQAQHERVVREWSRLAGEPVTVEEITGNLYAHGSELACLRLAYKFRRASDDRARCEYSKNLSTWVFSLEAAR